MSTNLPVLAPSLEEGRSIPFLRGERKWAGGGSRATPRRGERKKRERAEHITKQHPSKNPKRRKKGERKPRSRLFRQNKNKNPPVRTSSSPLSLSLSPPVRPLAHQIQFFPRPPSRIRRNSFASRARLLRVRGICSLFPLESCLGRRLEGGASEGEGRFCWASRGHGRCGAR